MLIFRAYFCECLANSVIYGNGKSFTYKVFHSRKVLVFYDTFNLSPRKTFYQSTRSIAAGVCLE